MEGATEMEKQRSILNFLPWLAGQVAQNGYSRLGGGSAFVAHGAVEGFDTHVGVCLNYYSISSFFTGIHKFKETLNKALEWLLGEGRI